MRQQANPDTPQLYSSDYDVASGSDATVPISANADHTWVVDEIWCSYAAAPTSGSLSVAIGGTTVFQQDITDAGEHYFPFTGGLYNAGTKNEAVLVTLADGGQAKQLFVSYR
jgi:hypothetical protein